MCLISWFQLRYQLIFATYKPIKLVITNGLKFSTHIHYTSYIKHYLVLSHFIVFVKSCLIYKTPLLNYHNQLQIFILWPTKSLAKFDTPALKKFLTKLFDTHFSTFKNVGLHFELTSNSYRQFLVPTSLSNAHIHPSPLHTHNTYYNYTFIKLSFSAISFFLMLKWWWNGGTREHSRVGHPPAAG